MEIFADTQDENVVYVLNAPVTKSIDGGKTFAPLSTPHGDNHDLWIHPHNNKIMINSNDGGANISNNGGKSWNELSKTFGAGQVSDMVLVNTDLYSSIINFFCIYNIHQI